MDGSDMGQENASGSGNMKHDKYHDSVHRLPDGGYGYAHGAFTGHILPGSFFVVWGSWWALSTFVLYLRCRIGRKPFRSRPWHTLPAGPAWLRNAPLEPVLKVLLPLVGVLGELWLGHPSWRTLYASDGKFVVDNINDWQHSLMYLCFITSGVVDLLGHYIELPTGMEQVFLGLAYLGELVLLVFHLKGPHIEILLHLILALLVAATVLAVVAEILVPSSLVAACLRPYFTILQGAWWIQVAYAMYTSSPPYDPDYMGGEMMVPAVFVLHMLWIAFAMLLVLVVLRAVAAQRAGRPLTWEPTPESAAASPLRQHLPMDEEEPGDLALELSNLMPAHKTFSHSA